MQVAARPTPLPPELGAPAPERWKGILLATMKWDHSGNTHTLLAGPARGTYFGSDPVFVPVRGGFEDALKAASAAARGKNLPGWADSYHAHAVLQAEGGRLFITPLQAQRGDGTGYPRANFDRADGTTNDVTVKALVDDLKAIVGGHSWIDLR